MTVWKAVITSRHPRQLSREDRLKSRLCAIIIWSDPGRSHTISQGEMSMENLCFFGGPGIYFLGLWMLISACQYISLLDSAKNECKSRGSSESKKGVTHDPRKMTRKRKPAMPSETSYLPQIASLFKWSVVAASVRKESSRKKDSQRKKKANVSE